MSWRKEVLETFASLGTKPDEWKPCEMDYDGDGAYMAMGTVNDHNFVRWKIPDGYKMAETRFSSEDFSGEFRYEEEGAACCHLCGHWIVYECFIQHNEKKLYMKVGSSCVENFDIPGIVAKKRRQYVAKVVLREFDKFAQKVRKIRQGFLDKRKFMPRWLWDAEKSIQHADTNKKRTNFLKKYTVLLDEAAIQESYDAWRFGQ